MTLQNEQVLAEVCPELADRVRAAIAGLQLEHTYVAVVAGLRTAAQQQGLYAQGRTAPGHIVTNAQAGYSMHNYGLAVDVVPFLAGPAGALNWNPSTPQFQRMVAAFKAQELEWGGDWKGSLGDFDHFQWMGLPASPTLAMRADYAAEAAKGAAGLPLVWHKAEQQAYAA